MGSHVQLDLAVVILHVEGAEALAIISLRPSNPDALGTLLVVGVLQPSAQIAADL